jgi:predicted DNA-binding ribbon-helix-helix protein
MHNSDDHDAVVRSRMENMSVAARSLGMGGVVTTISLKFWDIDVLLS